MQQVVFVTDDEKEDWWLTIDSGGLKRSRPRPELTDELRREAGVGRFFMVASERFAQIFAPILKVPLSNATLEQVRDVRSTLRESVKVACPICGTSGVTSLGVPPGSSAIHHCLNCRMPFHVNRGGDGQVIIRQKGTKTGSFVSRHIEVTCPSCSGVVPANIREGQDVVERYCMGCCSLLKISDNGQIISDTPSQSLPTSFTSDGKHSYLRCPECPGEPLARALWRNDVLIRGVCPECRKLLQAPIESSSQPD